MPARLLRISQTLLLVVLVALLMGRDAPRALKPGDQVRMYTRGIEYDFAGWTLNAAWIKLEQIALGTPGYFPRAEQKRIVSEYLLATQRILSAERELNILYGDPSLQDRDAAMERLRAELDELYRRQRALAPLAEAVLQEQVSAVLAEQGLTTGGQPVPPVLYHVSPLPLALVLSPRDVIRYETLISLTGELTVDEQIALEEKVMAGLNLSALVVPVGGMGAYPTMVMETTDLRWLVSTVAHEWIHNFLTLRPLGMNYNQSSELRTMNETAASLAGDEIGALVLARYYPETIASAPTRTQTIGLPAGRADPHDLPVPPFDFRAEMRLTRVTADELLAQGKIEEAEAYLEMRRQFFWERGYRIRRLNQAYFAFHGAYADLPGGAAGEDPVGPAVRALRARSRSLAEFLHRIARMSSFDDLLAALEEQP